MARLIQRSYSIPRVLAQRDKIVKRADALVGQTLTPDLFQNLIERFQRAMSKDISQDLLRESLLHLAGRELSRAALMLEAWRVAGNMERLLRFHPVPPWNRQVADEYVPVQVTSTFKCYRNDKEYVELSLRVLAGTTATMVLKKTWSPKFCSMLSTSLGFSKPWDEHRFDDPRQLVGLRFYVLIEQRLCTAVPAFEKLWMGEDTRIRPVSCYTQNRQLIKLRNRVLSNYPCPAKLKPEVACHECVLGLERCALAVHDKTFTKQKCHYCNREAWFDPQVSTRMCIGCCDLQAKGEL